MIDTNMLFSGFTVQSTLNERGMIVKLAGYSSSTGTDGEKLKRELLRICAEHPKVLVLDLGELMEINSVVLGALLLCMRLMAASGGSLRLAAIRPSILEVLRHSHLLELFDVRPDVEAALSAP